MMDAADFIYTHQRMCAKQENCESCKVYGNCLLRGDHNRCRSNIRREVALVEEWAANHPEKTRWTLLKEQYPNISDDMKHKICARYLGYDYRWCHPSLCGDCWDTPIEEEQE